ncbi:TPA: hypothetical protein ACP61A_004760, partial [Escherichia coli]
LNNKSPFPQECRFSDDFQTKTYKNFEEVSLKNAALLRNHLLPYKVTNKTNADELTATIKGAMQSVDNKPFDYYLCGGYDIELFGGEGFFNSIIVDIERACQDDYLTINGIQIKKNTLAQITRLIVSGKTYVNTVPLTGRKEYPQIINNLQRDYNTTEAEMIRAVFQKPQFPLALLAVVCQSIPSMTKPLLRSESNFLVYGTNFIRNGNNLSECYSALQNIKYDSIKLDIRMGETDNLYCGVKTFFPYLTKTGNLGLGKTYNCFSVEQDFVGGENLHDVDSINLKLKELIPRIETGVVL